MQVLKVDLNAESQRRRDAEGEKEEKIKKEDGCRIGEVEVLKVDLNAKRKN